MSCGGGGLGCVSPICQGPPGDCVSASLQVGRTGRLCSPARPPLICPSSPLLAPPGSTMGTTSCRAGSSGTALGSGTRRARCCASSPSLHRWGRRLRWRAAGGRVKERGCPRSLPACFHPTRPMLPSRRLAPLPAGPGPAPLRRLLCRHRGQRGLVHPQRCGHGLQRRGIRADHAKRAGHSADDVRRPAAAQPDQPGQQGEGDEEGGGGQWHCKPLCSGRP